ncbi:LysR family transcriptional regulator [Pseudomonas putida]|uniref:LysR family transcriptional regulator n=1 Tax=Pseudomonas putida TaxID=303 RepID=UPI00117BC7BB|nr:LysR family transcriptional regulator [Pseudomonas putida]TRO38253.1 LysR family transcriptional regulator [Pseudomonas putida]
MDSAQRVPAILSFVHTADCGSFAAAARTLNISSAAVSKNVAGLERALGVRLMNRTTRTLSLTTEGELFLRKARIALGALDEAVDSVSSERVAHAGKVRISTSAAFGRDHLLPAFQSLQKIHPELSIEVDFDDRRIDLVRDGYDLAVRGGQINDSGLVSRPICHLNLVLVASAEYLARNGIPQTPKCLTAHRLIARRFLSGQMSRWAFRIDQHGLSVMEFNSVSLTLSAPEALLEAALLGMGIAQVGVHLAWPYLQNGKLKVVLNDCHHPGTYEMVLQYPHRALLAPRVKSTIAHLLDTLSQDKALHVPLDSLHLYSAY